MSKLAHSNDETMMIIEITKQYDELSEHEFFEALDGAPDYAEFVANGGMGQTMLNDYMNYIYLHVK